MGQVTKWTDSYGKDNTVETFTFFLQEKLSFVVKVTDKVCNGKLTSILVSLFWSPKNDSWLNLSNKLLKDIGKLYTNNSLHATECGR